jgi:hypothetical protein
LGFGFGLGVGLGLGFTEEPGMASGHWAEAVELLISLLFPYASAYVFHVEFVVSEHSQHGQWYSPLFHQYGNNLCKFISLLLIISYMNMILFV